jgi:hypothetical protein
MDVDLGTGKGRALGLVAVGLAIALAPVDFVVLRGERVDATTVHRILARFLPF